MKNTNEAKRNEDTVEPLVRPRREFTDEGYQVTGPDKYDRMCIDLDMETNLLWLTRSDVEMLLSRWPNGAGQGRRKPYPEPAGSTTISPAPVRAGDSSGDNIRMAATPAEGTAPNEGLGKCVKITQ